MVGQDVDEGTEEMRARDFWKTVTLDGADFLDRLDEVEALLGQAFAVERFPPRVNVSARGSDLRVQLQTDRRYAAFVERAEPREVLGLRLPVARVEDVLQGKIWAAMDAGRRASKRQKDLADIARLIEAFPHLSRDVPDDVLSKLL